MPEFDPKKSFRNMVSRYLDQVEYSAAITEESPTFPAHVHIEPTNTCNLRCVHCHHHLTDEGRQYYKRKQGLMDYAMYERIIDEIAPLGCSITLDVQGEPTLHPRFLDMVKLAKQRGLYVSIITNATRLDEEMATVLLDMKLDRVVFSFDAVDKDVYESIRVNSDFEPTLRNLLRFVRLNHERGHVTHICMSAVVQERNRDHLEDYQRFFESIPVDKVFLNQMLNLAGEAGTSGEVDLEAVQVGPKESWPICRIPWEDITVNWDGSVCLCPVDVNVNYSVGNVAETSLVEMWNNERSRCFRRAHITKDYESVEQNGPLCSKCNCLFDPEYDLSEFKTHALEAICRSALHHAPGLASLASEGEEEGMEDKYANLLSVIEKLGE